MLAVTSHDLLLVREQEAEEHRAVFRGRMRRVGRWLASGFEEAEDHGAIYQDYSICCLTHRWNVV